MTLTAKGICICLLMFGLVAFAGDALAGSAGVRNGKITGHVYGDGGPLSNVFVVAVRQEEPPLIRSAKTGADGLYVLKSTPLGKWILGFSKFGFKPITTEGGDPTQQTAVGEQVIAYVESGRTFVAPDVNLQALPSSAPGNSSVRVIDAVTGEPIDHATLLLGPESATGSGSGSYNVAVTPVYDEGGNLLPHQLIINADGYEQVNDSVQVPGGTNTSQTVTLQPLMVTLSGVVKLDTAIDPSQYGEISVIVANVPGDVAQGRVVDSTGLFEVRVPASNSRQTRSYDVSFMLGGHHVTTMNGIIAPRAGIRRVTTPVSLQAKTVQAAGQVITSSGEVPTSDGISSAVIVEIGRSVPVQGGSFSLEGVPVGRSLTLRITVRNPTTGAIEQGDMTFTASDASGGFALPVIITTPVTAGR